MLTVPSRAADVSGEGVGHILSRITSADSSLLSRLRTSFCEESRIVNTVFVHIVALYSRVHVHPSPKLPYIFEAFVNRFRPLVFRFVDRHHESYVHAWVGEAIAYVVVDVIETPIAIGHGEILELRAAPRKSVVFWRIFKNGSSI